MQQVITDLIEFYICWHSHATILISFWRHHIYRLTPRLNWGLQHIWQYFDNCKQPKCNPFITDDEWIGAISSTSQISTSQQLPRFQHLNRLQIRIIVSHISWGYFMIWCQMDVVAMVKIKASYFVLRFVITVCHSR